MAAFIQKLFRSRKAPSRPATPPPAVAAPEQDILGEQLTLLSGAPTESQLEALALEGKTAEVRLQAAATLKNPEALQRLQKAARGRDKGVYQSVRQRLQQLRETEAERQRLEEAVSTTIQQAEEHARTENTQLYEPRLEKLVSQWTSLESAATGEQITAFLEAVRQCRARISEMGRLLEAERALDAKAEERRNTLAVLEATLNELKSQPEDRLPSLPALDAMQKTQENRWQEANRDAPADPDAGQAYERLTMALHGYIAAMQRFEQQRPDIDLLLADEQPADPTAAEACKALVQAIDWPAGYARPAALANLIARAGELKKAETLAKKPDNQSQQKATLSATLTSLESALEARQLKEARQLFKQVQQEARLLDERNARPFQARVQLLTGQLRELQDWQGFVTQPKQIELCERMEHLAGQSMEPEAKAEKIKELQTEWRALGGSSDRELWQRFKQASDQAYEPCKEYFAAKSDLKKINLEKRQAICTELTAFIEQVDWQTVDWKAVERIDRVAREEWKAAWPVEFRNNRSVQKRFDELLGQLDGPLQKERERNEAIKQDIVDRAKALIEHEPLTEAMSLAKSLQGEWTAVGLTRHRQDRKLWQAFRTACDSIFARREAHKNEQENRSREADEKLSNLLEQLDTAPDTLDEPVNALQSMQSRPLSAAMKERLAGRLAELREQQKLAQMAGQVKEWQQRIQDRLRGELDPASYPPDWHKRVTGLPEMTPRELVVRAEIASASPTPDEDKSLRMEIQVQRLAEGMGGGSETPDSRHQIESLIACWCLKYSPAQLDSELARRLAASLDAIAA